MTILYRGIAIGRPRIDILVSPEFICGIIADYCVIETPLKKIYVRDSVLQLSGPHKKATETGEPSTTSDKPKRIDNDASLAVVQRPIKATMLANIRHQTCLCARI